MRDLLDYDGNVINPDEQLAKIAQDQPGGFGGFYFDDNDASIVYAFMKDPTETAAAKAAFDAAYGEHSITQAIPIQGDYAFSDLVKWYDIMDTALVRSGVIPGDSGAPVIAPISGDDVELWGTLFSGHSNWFHFAKLGLIYYELDSPATWDSCVSGCQAQGNPLQQ